MSPGTSGRGDCRSRQLVILVTGAVGRGKTRFVERLHRELSSWWRTCGFFCVAESPKRRAEAPAESYRLLAIDRPEPLPWAKRRVDGLGFEFCEETRRTATTLVRSHLDQGQAELCFLDEIGELELSGLGFAQLFHDALRSPCRVVVAAVKKSVLPEVMSAFGLTSPLIIDLDTMDAKAASRVALSRVSACDAERIGTFAGIGGLVEVGLGSTLHAYAVPLKGHALAYLQTLLLITFGKALRGRGLVRISLLSAMLKAFSPMGNTFRPMAYIFLQGVTFAAPIRLLGWNLVSVLLGAVLLSSLSLGLSLTMDYVVFGPSIFAALTGAVAALCRWSGTPSPSLAAVLGAAFALKAVLAIGLGATAYFGNLQPFIRKLPQRLARHGTDAAALAQTTTKRRTWAGTAFASLRDLVRPRFVLTIMISALLLLFFTGLSQGDVVTLVARGLCISYLGFVVMRRIDAGVLGNWLDRRAGLGLAESLPVALGVLSQTTPPKPDDAQAEDSDRSVTVVLEPVFGASSKGHS